MSHFYTNVISRKNKIYVRGIKDGSPYSDIVSYQPYLFTLGEDKTSPYKNVYGHPVIRKDFNSINEAKDFCKKYDDVDGYPVYGMIRFEYPYIYDNFTKDIEFDASQISVVVFDIENAMTIPCDIHTAVTETPNEITSITLSKNGHKTILSTVDYVTQDDQTYYKCTDEWHLLRLLLTLWNSPEFSPDVISGYNINGYDIPYLYNRMAKVLGEELARTLSPYGMVRAYEIEVFGKKTQSYVFEGISSLDYMELYLKFIAVYKPLERYSLDHVSFIELGENKIDYKTQGYKNLDDLFKRNPQLYLEYNARDCDLIDRLDAKLNLFQLAFTIAYRTKVNFGDIFGSVLKWDCMIHTYLMDRGIVVEPSVSTPKNMPYPLVGGYIKEPTPGMYNWTAYFDLKSLYPRVIQQYSISSENFVKRVDFDIDEFFIIDEQGSNEYTQQLKTYKSLEYAKENNLSLAPNGCLYKKEDGFLSNIMKDLEASRDITKKKMLTVKQEYVRTKNKDLIPIISSLDSTQTAFKLLNNEGFGAIANKWNRWFSFNNAESITTGGRLTIRWTEKKFNQYLNKLYQTKDIDYVVYMVTDSCILNMEKLVKQVLPDETDPKKIAQFLYNVCENKLIPFIHKCYEELAYKMNAYEQKMSMKSDSISEAFLIRAKSQYIMNVWNQEGVVYDEANLVMKGIKAVKISTPEVCRGSLKEAFKILMKGNEGKLHDHVKSFEDKFKLLNFHLISTPGGTNTMNAYPKIGDTFSPKTPIGVKAAHTYNSMIENLTLKDKYDMIGQGDKIRYAYLRMPNPAKSNVIACIDELPEEFELSKYIDYYTQFDKTYLDTLSPILDIVGWSSKKKSNLEGLFD